MNTSINNCLLHCVGCWFFFQFRLQRELEKRKAIFIYSVPVNFFHKLYNELLTWNRRRVFSGFFQCLESAQKARLNHFYLVGFFSWLYNVCIWDLVATRGHLLFSLQLMTLQEYPWHTAAVSDNYDDKFCCCQSQHSLSRTNVTALTEHTTATRGYLSCRPFVGYKNTAWHLFIASNCVLFLEVCN